MSAVVAGTVEDFDEAELARVASTFAILASVDVSSINVTVASASVILTVRINADSVSLSNSIANELSSQLANASIASSLLGLTAISDPAVSANVVTTLLLAPPSPPSTPPSPLPVLPPPAPAQEGLQQVSGITAVVDSETGGIRLINVVFVGAGASLLLGFACIWAKQRQKRKAKVAPAPRERAVPRRASAQAAAVIAWPQAPGRSSVQGARAAPSDPSCAPDGDDDVKVKLLPS